MVKVVLPNLPLYFSSRHVMTQLTGHQQIE